MDVSKAKVIIYEKGDHTYLSEKFAEKFAKVWHYIPILGRQPKMKEDLIGSGLDGVEKIDNFEEYKDKADLIVFPSEYDGEICNEMWKEGRRAYGSGMCSEYEIDRILFLKTLKQLGLPLVKTAIIDGLDKLEKYFEKNDNRTQWVKTPYHRGEFDTQRFDNLKTFQGWITEQRLKLGKGGSNQIKLLVQENYPCVVESGSDRNFVRGKRTPQGTCGYEKKDKWYIYKVFKKIPDILDEIDAKMERVFQEEKDKDGKLINGAYSGQYSTEVRINSKTDKRFTDVTCRNGEPPTSGICESYDTFCQDVFDVADGKMPQMKAIEEYGAIIIMDTDWKHEVCVDFPKEIKQNVKLKHYYKEKGNYYCVPNENEGYFGSVSAKGKTMKEAIDKVNEYAEQIVCLGLNYEKIRLDEATDMITKGRKFGIDI